MRLEFQEMNAAPLEEGIFYGVNLVAAGHLCHLHKGDPARNERDLLVSVKFPSWYAEAEEEGYYEGVNEMLLIAEAAAGLLPDKVFES